MPITKLEDLKPDPRNANRGTPRGHSIIERSVRERGAGRSGLAAADGTMIAGSQTLQKMAELGMKIKPVHTSGDEWVVVIRDDIAPGSEEATLLALEDNRSSEVGLEWEPDVLAAIAAEFDVSALFTADELADIALPGLQEPQDDPPVTIDDTKPTRCQAGDVWRVGRHTVACVDSTDRATVTRLIAARKVGMVVADPPYGMNLDTRYAVTEKVKGKSYDPVLGDDRYFDFGAFDWIECKEQFWWGADYYCQLLPVGGSWFVWDKKNEDLDASIGSGFELCWSKTQHKREVLRFLWSGFTAHERDSSRVHPTQKPIALFDWLYQKYGTPADLIFDPFLGSGPSIKAAEPLGRTVIGCELSPHYVDHVLEWAEQNGLEVELVPAG